MIAGRRYWIIIWYGILLLGILGLWASVYWGRRTRWRNLDELFRATGTILISIGMLLLLHRFANWLGTPLLVVALGLFIAAFVSGRLQHPERHSGAVRIPVEDGPPPAPAASSFPPGAAPAPSSPSPMGQGTTPPTSEPSAAFTVPAHGAR